MRRSPGSGHATARASRIRKPIATANCGTAFADSIAGIALANRKVDAVEIAP
jgi:hypothetical protein